MGVDLTGSELDNKKGLVVWYPILLIIACAHWSQGLREVEGEENRLKRRWEDQLCAPCSVPESVGSDRGCGGGAAVGLGPEKWVWTRNFWERRGDCYGC